MPFTTKVKPYKIGANKAGKRYAIVLDPEMNLGGAAGTYGVWAERSNYCGHARSGIRKSWGYCKIRLSLEEAEALFLKKIAGKVRP